MSMKKLRSGEKTDLSEAHKGTCENCGDKTWVRKVEVFSAFSGASRGWYDFCFKCFGPQIIWYKGREEIHSPMRIPYDELDSFLEKYFLERNR